MEMSEVMATQFTEMLLNIKKRSNEDQLMQVRGLQYCDILLTKQVKFVITHRKHC